MRLYDLAGQYQMLLEMIDEDIDNEALKIMLNGINERLEEKIENTTKVIKAIESDIECITKEVERLTDRAKSLKNKRDFLKQNIKDSMQAVNKDKIKGSLFTVWIQENRPSVIVLDENSIPKEYFVQPEPQLRKTGILEAWEKGVIVPGTEIRKEKSLRVR